MNGIEIVFYHSKKEFTTKNKSQFVCWVRMTLEEIQTKSTTERSRILLAFVTLIKNPLEWTINVNLCNEYTVYYTLTWNSQANLKFAWNCSFWKFIICCRHVPALTHVQIDWTLPCDKTTQSADAYGIHVCLHWKFAMSWMWIVIF